MKKFLLSAFAVAVAFSAAAFNMAPNQKALTPKAFTGKTDFVAKPVMKKLVKTDAKDVSVNDISGDYVMIYYSYFNDYAATFSGMTITKVSGNTYKISGWWSSSASDITATVNTTDGTVTIERQEVYRYTSGSTYEAADLVNVENLLDDDESNDDDFSTPLVGEIYLDGIVFDAYWGIMITEHSTASAVGKFFEIGAMAYLLEPSGTMTWQKSGAAQSAPVYLEQSNDTVFIGNFGGWGYNVYAILGEGRTFEVPMQETEDAGDDYGIFYIIGLSDDAEDVVDLVGTGTETTLTASTHWTNYSDAGYWYGDMSPFTITRTDGDVFIWGDEPVIPDVYILGQVGDNDWAPNVGQQMVYDADTQKYTAEIECKDADNNGYDYFAFSTKLGENADDWDGIAGYRFGAVSNGDFLVTDELLGTELSLTAPGESYQVVKGKYNLTLDYANMKLIIEKVAEPFAVGDVNGDGDVNVMDITELINIIMNDITDNPRANVNGDNSIDVMDITALIDIIMNS